MFEHFNSPFVAGSESKSNACIAAYRGFQELADDLRRSADTLVVQAMRDSTMLDVHIYAICFLYRHSFELLLKDLSWRSYNRISLMAG
ncbi:MAG: hypothetical protein PVJ57_17470 [Phycisphaerae bacterium]|jgi:hypothetical protein